MFHEQQRKSWTNSSLIISSLLPSRVVLEKKGWMVRSAAHSASHRAMGISQPAISWFSAWEQAVRLGSAGRYGICSYQQESSALQSLRGEGGNLEAWKNGLRWRKSGNAASYWDDRTSYRTIWFRSHIRASSEWLLCCSLMQKIPNKINLLKFRSGYLQCFKYIIKTTQE